MPNPLPPRRPAPPAFWMVFVTKYLRAPEEIAVRLWHAYEPTCSLAVRWQLDQVVVAGSYATAVHLGTLLPPADLMAAAEQLCVPGRLRRRELIDLEEAILEGTTKEGTWR